jgi:hypothetical protein
MLQKNKIFVGWVRGFVFGFAGWVRGFVYGFVGWVRGFVFMVGFGILWVGCICGLWDLFYEFGLRVGICLRDYGFMS